MAITYVNGSEIPLYGVARQYHNLREEILDVTDRVLASGKVLDGRYTKQFERAIAERCGRKYAISVNSATQGLVFSLEASVGFSAHGVLIPAISFAATLNSVLQAGYLPVMCDVDAGALIDLDSVNTTFSEARIGTVMYANLFGHVIDYDRFQVHTSFFNSDVVVIEDAAQSFGARYKDRASGSLGNISVLSFDPTKNLNNYGSGGMILTDNETYYEILQDLKDNGKPSGHHFRGTNSKMSEVDCAQMLIKLKYFDHWQQRRQDIANYYTDCLSAYVDVVLPGPDVTSAWSKYVIRTMGRDNLRSHLSSRGIETRATYSAPLFDHPVGYGYANFAGHHFDQSIKFSRECLSLPIYPELTDSEVEFVANSVKEFLIK